MNSIIKNESSSKENNDNQNDKIKNNNYKNKNNNENNNSSNNDIKNESIKIKQQNKNYNRPGTVVNINKNFNNEKYPIEENKNNIGIITNNELINESKKNRNYSGHVFKKIVNQGPKTVNVNIYNATINSLGQPIPALNFKPINKKKANSINQKENKYFLKQNTINMGKRGFMGKRKEETRTIENMINNLNNYVPKNDINVDENNYLGLKKKK